MIRAVLFDFDDTLGNRESYAYALYHRIITDAGIEDHSDQCEAVVQHCMIWDQNGNENKNYVKRKLKEIYGIDLKIEDLDVYWDDHLYEYVSLFPHAQDVLKTLRMRGYKTGVITNGKSYGQRKKIEQSGIEPLLDTVVVSAEAGFEKPDTRIFDCACRQLHLNAQECAFVGDTWPKDIIGAISSGMMPVWYWPHGYRACSRNVVRIRDLTDLLELFKGV